MTAQGPVAGKFWMRNPQDSLVGSIADIPEKADLEVNRIVTVQLYL